MSIATCSKCGNIAFLPINESTKTGRWSIKAAIKYLIDKQRKHKCNGGKHERSNSRFN